MAHDDRDTEPAQQDDTPADSLAGEIRAARPRKPALGREHRRARLGAQLFGTVSEPERLGRFVLLDRLGQGGMGVVYSAYDPELDRRVALKLLHPDLDGDGGGDRSERKRARLLQEAKALARLSHPNVVAVHDVGVINGQVFLVMELVRGQTLRAWLAAGERSWREVLAVYDQAGHGLAAAHAEGWIHRDFKPENVLVGEDGRVRVLDFGLARALPAEHVHGRTPAGEGVDGRVEVEVALSTQASAQDATALGHAHTVPQAHQPWASATVAGVVKGTPAYMSPEQRAGARLGPLSDQFSFCLALYEGLYGRHPFAGDAAAAGDDTAPALDASRNSSVPGWVHAVVCRGLARDPRARHPSMQALLDALGRDPGRTRRRRLLALVFLALAGMVLFTLLRYQAAAARVCAGAGEEVAAIWNQQRRDALARAFLGTGQVYARDAWPQVAAGLDAYAASWVEMHGAACMAHQRGAQSDALFDRRMACLQRRRAALANAIDVLAELHAGSLARGVELVRALPPLGYCADADALMAEIPPPEDPALARRVDALRGRLLKANALERAGRYGDALAVIDAVLAEAEPLDYRPLEAQSLLARGRIQMGMRQGQPLASLERATLLGLASGMDELAVEALARRIHLEGMSPEQPLEAFRTTIPLAEALAERLAAPSFARGLLFNNLGTVHMAHAAPAQARAYFVRALETMQGAAEPNPIDLGSTLRNLALVIPETERRAALFQQALAVAEGALGSTHPTPLDLRLTRSHYTIAPQRARDLLAPVCEAMLRYQAEQRAMRAQCDMLLGYLEAALGRPSRAAEAFARAADLATAADHNLAAGLAHFHRGEHQAALSLMQAAFASWQAQPARWWLDRLMAEAQLGMGASLHALGRHGDAAEALEQSVRRFERFCTTSQQVSSRRHLAQARALLASALWALARPGEEGAALRSRAAHAVAQAERWYREVGGHEQALAALAAWRRERGL